MNLGPGEDLKKKTPQSVSVIVPVRNGGEKFRCCLLSILAARQKPEEVIVVADGDTDGSGVMAASMGIRVISTGPSPLGPAGARNAGAQAATGDILFFVDADVEMHHDCVGLVRKFFVKNPSMAAAIGSYDDAPFETNFFSQYKNLFHRYTHQRARSEASTFWGACGAVQREVFFETGGFDERFTRPSIEDIELGYRLKKSGHRIRLLKNLQVKHLKEWRFMSLLKSDIFDRAIPWTRLILKQKRIPSDLNLKITDRISCLAVFGLIMSLPFTFMNRWLWIVAGVCLSLIIILNKDLYLYFLRLRGVVFAVKSMLFHWLYLCYSGLSFMFGKMSHRSKGFPDSNHDPNIKISHGEKL